jgi:hypothetical protein
MRFHGAGTRVLYPVLSNEVDKDSGLRKRSLIRERDIRT